MRLKKALKTVKVKTYHVYVYTIPEGKDLPEYTESFDIIRDDRGNLPDGIRYLDCRVSEIIPLQNAQGCNLSIISNHRKRDRKRRISDLEKQMMELRRQIDGSMESQSLKNEETIIQEPEIRVYQRHRHM